MFDNKKLEPSRQPVTVHLIDAHKRAKPIPFTLNSTDLTGLLIEAIQLGKLVATEKRDLEAIRSNYKERSERLENLHNEIMTEIKEFYGQRQAIIDKINHQSDQLIAAGQYDVAEVLLSKLIDMVANHSPLRTAIELRNERLLT